MFVVRTVTEELVKSGVAEALSHTQIPGLPYMYDLDKVFVGIRTLGLTYGVEVVGEKVRASQYWTKDGLRCPSDSREIAVWTRRTFKYPKATVIAKLPLPKTGVFYYPIALFSMATSEWNGAIEFHSYDSEQYDILVASEWRTAVQHPRVFLQDLLPANYDTGFHTYSLKINKWGVEFFIDGRLRAVAIGVNRDVKFHLSNTKPYAITVGYANIGSEYTFGLRVGNVGTAPATWQERILPISPHFVAVGDGDPLPPRAYHLYNTGTDNRLAGMSITTDSVTSYPVPMWGYDRKVLYFMADQAGTLEIQVLSMTNNWRTYDSVSVSANTLLKYRIEDPVILARAVFTPSTYPATILDFQSFLIASLYEHAQVV